MSNYELYAQSIDDAVLAYSATEDTNYPITNIQDRNKNTFMKDTAIAAATVNIVIDFGAARSCNYIFLGSYIATAADAAQMRLEAHTADVWVGAQTVALANTLIDSSSLVDKLMAFTAQNFRYWRMVFTDISAGNLTDLQFGTVFLGTKWNWAHEPELRKPDDSGYIVTGSEAGGGDRFSQITGTTPRRIWGIPVQWNTAAEVTKMETFRDQIFMDQGGGLSSPMESTASYRPQDTVGSDRRKKIPIGCLPVARG